MSAPALARFSPPTHRAPRAQELTAACCAGVLPWPSRLAAVAARAHSALICAPDAAGIRSPRTDRAGSGSYAKAAFALAAVTAALAFAGCGTLDRDAVQNEISKAASTAAEGMLVAREASSGRTWKSFVEIRTAELHGAAEKSEEKLTEPTDKGLASAAQRGSKLAAQVRAALGSLHEHPADRRLATSTENRLRRLADELNGIEQRL